MNIITVKGSQETRHHTLGLQKFEGGLYLTNGAYFVGGEKVFELTDTITIDIPKPEETTHYQIVICRAEIVVLERKDNEFFEDVENRIDLLAYYTYNPNVHSSFEQVEVNFVKVEIPDENNQ